MADNEQITLRFETTNLGTGSVEDDLLLSGPVDIFATLDTFDELKDKDLLDAVKENLKDRSIIVFVKDVRNSEILGSDQDTQDHRGAYFVFKGFVDSDNSEPIWQECLLGTHSHHNIGVLENLSKLPYGELDKEKIIMMTPDGDFTFTEQEKSLLPEFPSDFQEKLNEIRKNYDYLDVPTNSEEHHLDAKLEELVDTYDWQNPVNIAVGTCRDLYRALVKGDKKLYLKLPEYEMTTEKQDSDIYFGLFIEEVSFDENNKDYLHLEYNPVDKNYYLNFPIKGLDIENDSFFLFDGDKIVKRSGYKYSITGYDAENGILHLVINKKYFDSEVDIHNITMLVVYNSKTVDDFDTIFREMLEEEKLKLQDINAELVKLYIEGEINRRPAMPHLYLTTDDKGNIVWDNKLTPVQNFYSAQKDITKDDLKDAEEKGNNYLVLHFEGVYFDATKDFPILMVDELFNFQDKPIPNLDGSVDYKLKIENDHFNLEAGTKITLVVIRSGAGNSLADELADKYISKKDAVEILSHGKLSLDDYATITNLKDYAAKKYHTHSQYAYKDHNHDFRYANYHHTHPELYLVIEKLLNGKVAEDDLKKWVDEINAGSTEAIENLKKALDEISTDEIHLPEDFRNTVNESILNYNETHKNNKDFVEIPALEETDNLSIALERIIEIFKKETINDDKVILSKDLTIDAEVGGLVKGTIYEAGTDLRKLLVDMLNPYYDLDTIRGILTPNKANTKIHWFIKDSTDSYIEINPEHIQNADYIGKIYFTIETKNKFGEDCIYKDTEVPGGKEYSEVIIYPKDEYTKDASGYYLYGDVDFTNREFALDKDIEFSWKSNYADDIIYDSHGETPIVDNKLNPDDNTILFKKEEFIFNIDRIDLYYGVISSEFNLDELTLDNSALKASYISRLDNVELNISETNNRILLLVEDDVDNLEVQDAETHHNILKYFEKHFADTEVTKYYTIYYYDVLTPENVNLILRVKN